MDSGFRRNDEFFEISTFYEMINLYHRSKGCGIPAEIIPAGVEPGEIFVRVLPGIARITL
jgi:hypothetical protein